MQIKIHNEIFRLIKKCHNTELENQKAIISSKKKELISFRPLYNAIKSSDQNEIDILPSKFKKLFNKIKSKILTKIDYENRRFELMEELELTDSVETDKYALMERYHLVQGRNKTFLKPD